MGSTLIVNQIKSWTLASAERVRQATDFLSSTLDQQKKIKSVLMQTIFGAKHKGLIQNVCASYRPFHLSS